ncbi:rcc01693 family protein [Methylobrevis pamukkalensis]|uniref:rcc01693 family protein n=1 Tax=Methylobrevis pamukkalensis TaxID=1439726 RepID=UPI0009F7451C
MPASSPSFWSPPSAERSAGRWPRRAARALERRARAAFPWAAAMQAGLGRLRLAPREFWATTPRELAAAFSGPAGAAMRRGRLDDLMGRYPDTVPDADGGACRASARRGDSGQGAGDGDDGR